MLVSDTPGRKRFGSDIKDLHEMVLVVTSTWGCTGHRSRIDPQVCALNALVYDRRFVCMLSSIREVSIWVSGRHSSMLLSVCVNIKASSA